MNRFLRSLGRCQLTRCIVSYSQKPPITGTALEQAHALTKVRGNRLICRTRTVGGLFRADFGQGSADKSSLRRVLSSQVSTLRCGAFRNGERSMTNQIGDRACSTVVQLEGRVLRRCPQ